MPLTAMRAVRPLPPQRRPAPPARCAPGHAQRVARHAEPAARRAPAHAQRDARHADPAARDDHLSALLARVVAGRGATGVPSTPGPMLQRYDAIPALVDWKRVTSGWGFRSAELAAIDAAITEYHAALTAIPQRRALIKLESAISKWNRVHPDDKKRQAAVKELFDIEQVLERTVVPLANAEIKRTKLFEAYEDAVEEHDLATAAAETTRLLAAPAHMQEFNDYLKWCLSTGETDGERLAVRFMAGHRKGPSSADVIRFTEHADLSWLDAKTTKWMFDNVITPLRKQPTFPDLLKHPQLLPKLAEHDHADYETLVAATPALQITAAVRELMEGEEEPGVFAATDALFAAALEGTHALQIAYSPTTVPGGGPPLMTAGLEEPAKLMCHTLARIFFDLFGIYAGQTSADWRVRTVTIKETLLTKPAGALRLAAGVSEGLVQKHRHAGNVIDSETGEATGQIFFNPGGGEPSHSYVTVDADGASRSYDPIFGIAWTGDWRGNDNAGIADLYDVDGDGFKAKRSDDRITPRDTAGAKPFTTRYTLTRA